MLSEREGNRPNNSNQGPVVVHIHGDGSVEGTGVSSVHDATNNNDDSGNGGNSRIFVEYFCFYTH